MKTTGRGAFSLVLSLIMCLTLFHVVAFAADGATLIKKITVEIPDSRGTQLTLTNIYHMAYGFGGEKDNPYFYYTPEVTFSCNKDLLLYYDSRAYRYSYCSYVREYVDDIDYEELVETYPAGTVIDLKSMKFSDGDHESNGDLLVWCFKRDASEYEKKAFLFPISDFYEFRDSKDYEEYKENLFPVSDMAVASATTVTANPTSAKVMVDGVETSFDAYNISGNNYFKLRDIAFVLKDKFEIGFSDGKITLTQNAAYTAVGGEMTAGDGTSKDAAPSTDKVYMNGVQLDLTAYKIGGNNYFKLRDVAKTLGFDVDWRDSMIWIEKNEAYTED